MASATAWVDEQATLREEEAAPGRRLLLVPIVKLEPHPDNPRLVIDGERLRALACEMGRAKTFDRVHAITVRPHADRYQIVSGHRRVEAARLAGIAQVWAWVVDWDDERVLLELAFANRYEPLSPLEIGIHALKIEGAQGQRGRGRKAFAMAMGIADSNLARYERGASVYLAVVREHGSSHIDIGAAKDRALHFAEISRARSDLWGEMVKRCIDSEWSVARARDAVAEAFVRQVELMTLAPEGPETTKTMTASDPDRRVEVCRRLEACAEAWAGLRQVLGNVPWITMTSILEAAELGSKDPATADNIAQQAMVQDALFARLSRVRAECDALQERPLSPRARRHTLSRLRNDAISLWVRKLLTERDLDALERRLAMVSIPEMTLCSGTT
jgi:ParB-like chromosome segregation protein Spo0J